MKVSRIRMGADNWPLPEMVDLRQDRLRNGDLVAFGIHWVPDSKKRCEITSAGVPEDACLIGFSKDGREWTSERAVIEFPPIPGGRPATALSFSGRRTAAASGKCAPSLPPQLR